MSIRSTRAVPRVAIVASLLVGLSPAGCGGLRSLGPSRLAPPRDAPDAETRSPDAFAPPPSADPDVQRQRGSTDDHHEVLARDG